MFKKNIAITEKWNFGLYKNRSLVDVLALSLAVLTFFIVWYYSDNKKSGFGYFWDEIFDPAASIITVIISAYIAIVQSISNWERKLQDRFDLHLVYRGRVYVSFYDGIVVGKEDIRNQAQSIAKSIVGEWVDLTAYNSLKNRGIAKKEATYYKKWVFIMRINTLPKLLQDAPPYLYYLYTINENHLESSTIKGRIFDADTIEMYDYIDGNEQAKDHPALTYDDQVKKLSAYNSNETMQYPAQMEKETIE